MELMKLIEEATVSSPWDVGNEVLYKLCRRSMGPDIFQIRCLAWRNAEGAIGARGVREPASFV